MYKTGRNDCGVCKDKKLVMVTHRRGGAQPFSYARYDPGIYRTMACPRCGHPQTRLIDHALHIAKNWRKHETMSAIDMEILADLAMGYDQYHARIVRVGQSIPRIVETTTQ